jgi:hypothetical protein
LFLFLKTWLNLHYKPTTVFFETHGRFYTGIPELADSLGWFTQFYPLFTKNWTSLETLSEDISNQFDNLPENGLTYMEGFWYKPPFPVLLNFLGSFDENRGTLAIPSRISQGEMTDPNNPVLGYFELNALIAEGKIKWMLNVHPDINPDDFKTELALTIQKLMDYPDRPDYTADSIDQDDLNAIRDFLEGI